MAKKKEQPVSSVPTINIEEDPLQFWDSSRYKTYSDKLKHPLWQRRRLEIMNRDNWMCQMCGDRQSPLHVHHRYYLNGKHPWEYNDGALITLCECCHKKEEGDMPRVVELVTSGLRKHGCMAISVETFGNNLLAREMDTDIPGMLGFMLFDKPTFDMVKEGLLKFREMRKKLQDG